MKYLKYILVMAMTLIIMSHTSSRTSQVSEGISSGNLIPAISLTDSIGQEFSLSGLAGKKVLLSFWATHDAHSHIEMIRMAKAIEKQGYSIKIVGISLDKSKSVFEKTLTLEGLENTIQFNVKEGTQSNIYKKYRLDNGFKSFLIDENGLIQKVNPSIDDLGKLYVSKG